MGEPKIQTVRELLLMEDKSVPLIDNILWERDNVFIVGHEKSGKSILGMQIAFALSSGQPLFGEYEVKKPCRVLYIQSEGKIIETKDRLTSMLKVNDCDQDKLWWANFPSIALDSDLGYNNLIEMVKGKNINPEVIILDPLYHSMQGSLNDEHDARKMTVNLRRLSEEFNATIIVIHHTHKPIRTREGNVIDEGDDSIFGSFVWKAWADHTLLFKVNKGNKLRLLTCNTQRSGKVLEYKELLLIDDPFLSFEANEGQGKPYEIAVEKTIKEAKEGITREEIQARTKLSKSAVYKSINKLIQIGQIEKNVEHRPVVYKAKLVSTKDPT